MQVLPNLCFFGPRQLQMCQAKPSLGVYSTRPDHVLKHTSPREFFFLLWLDCVIDEDRMSFAGRTEDILLLVCRLFFHSIALSPSPEHNQASDHKCSLINF